MIEKIKEIPFVEESFAVHVVVSGNRMILERSTKVLWAREQSSFINPDVNCYVEARKFLPLLPSIAALSVDTCLNVTLTNGGKYQLPFLPVQWDSEIAPEIEGVVLNFKIADLSMCTLKNLIKPELQCIYIDEQGAVSCDFVSACIDSGLKSNKPLLLPPDVQDLVSGTTAQVIVAEDKMYIKGAEYIVSTTNPTFSDDRWWETLREMLGGVSTFNPTTLLPEALKRLVMFGDYVTFTGDKVACDSNFEPFSFTDLGQHKFEIERLAKILTSAAGISSTDAGLVIGSGPVKFLLSAVEEV